MSGTIAQLGIEINSSDAVQAAADLDKMTDSSKKTEEAAKKTGKAWEQAMSAMAVDTQQIIKELQALNAKQDTTAQMMATVGRSISSASSSFNAAASSMSSYRAQSETLNATQTKTAEGAQKASAAIKKEGDDIASLLGKIDPTVAALGRLDDMEKRLQGYKNKGLIDPSTFDEYKTKIDQSRTGLTRFDGSLERTGNTAKQTAAALRGVPAQFTDIAVSLQGGQSPLTVLLQQGGQLKDMFGGIGPAAKALGGYVAGLVNPFTVAAAAAAALGVAYYSGWKETDRFSKALILTGNYAGTSTGQLSSLAQSIGETVGTTSSAADALAQLASSGKVASGSFEEVTKAALNLKENTGKAVEDTIAEFVKIAQDPVAAAKTLNEQYGFLTLSVYSQIVALKEQGDTIGAAKLLTDTYANTIQNRSGEMVQNLGYVERAWRGIKNAAAGVLSAASDIGRETTLLEQKANVQAKLSDLEKKSGNFLVGRSEAVQKEKAELTGQLNILDLQIDAEKSRTKFLGDQATTRKSAIGAAAEVDALTKSTWTNEQKRNDELDKYRKNLAKIRAENPADARLKQDAVDKITANIKDKYKDPKAASAGAVDLSSFNDAQNALKELQATYSNSQKELDASQKAGVISQESYASQKALLINAEKEEVTKAYEAEISALEAVKGKTTTTAEQRIQLDQKIADARTDMVKAQKDADSQQKVLAAAEIGRLAKQKLAISNYTDALDQQNLALQRSGRRAVVGLGQGDRQASLTSSINGIEDKANQQRLDLARDKADASRNMSAEEYIAKLAAINKSEVDLKDTTLSNYEQMSAAQGDWRNGATSAFQNYLDSARDVAGQTKSLFTNAFSSMNDAIANFVTTGKFKFSDFAKSIISDMARIASQQASSALLGTLVGAATSYFAGPSGPTAAATAGGAQAGASNFASQFDASSATVAFPQAKGGAWSNGVQMFANGGAFTNSVVSTPTAFGMANGKTGVMGEAGDEAIMPLTRTANGALGVRAAGGGGGGNSFTFETHISVDGSGNATSSTSSSTAQSDAAGLAKMINDGSLQVVQKQLQAGGAIWRLVNGR